MTAIFTRSLPDAVGRECDTPSVRAVSAQSRLVGTSSNELHQEETEAFGSRQRKRFLV